MPPTSTAPPPPSPTLYHTVLYPQMPLTVTSLCPIQFPPPPLPLIPIDCVGSPRQNCLQQQMINLYWRWSIRDNGETWYWLAATAPREGFHSAPPTIREWVLRRSLSIYDEQDLTKAGLALPDRTSRATTHPTPFPVCGPHVTVIDPAASSMETEKQSDVTQ